MSDLTGCRSMQTSPAEKHFCSPTLLLGQVQGTFIFSWPISAASPSSYSFLFWVDLSPTLFSSSALSHLSPTSPSAFHSDFKACPSLPLPAFPIYLHEFGFQAADLWAAHFLPISLLTHGSSLPLLLASSTFHLFFFFHSHLFLWSLLNFCPQCSLPKAFISPFLHTYPQHTPAQPCCVSLAPSPPATSEILLVSQSCPSSSIWLSIPTKLHALTLHSSLLKVKVCPSIPHPYAFANISFGSTSPSMENRWWQSYSKADSIDLKFIPNSQCTFLS